jgi:SHS2 domain-containing protein
MTTPTSGGDAVRHGSSDVAEVRGHRARDHTADEIVEAWGPTRAACLEEVALGFVELVAVPDPDAVIHHHELTIEASGPTEALLDLLEELVFLLDAEGAVPARVRLEDRGASVAVHLDLVDLAHADVVGPAPKGVSHSGLALRRRGDGWWARAIIDV